MYKLKNTALTALLPAILMMSGLASKAQANDDPENSPSNYSSTHSPIHASAQLSIIDNPFSYSGYYNDSETGMYYLKARYYTPELMAFISRDTYDLPNRYDYCDNSPLMNSDPTGHMKVQLATEGGICSKCRESYNTGETVVKDGDESYHTKCFECQICLEDNRTVIEETGCGHLLCKECLDRIMSVDRRCAFCREPITRCSENGGEFAPVHGAAAPAGHYVSEDNPDLNGPAIERALDDLNREPERSVTPERPYFRNEDIQRYNDLLEFTGVQNYNLLHSEINENMPHGRSIRYITIQDFMDELTDRGLDMPPGPDHVDLIRHVTFLEELMER